MKKRTAETGRLKKAGSMAGLLIFLLAAPVSALEPISEKEMDTVTGKRGVNFVLDDIQIYKHKDSGGLWFQDGSHGQAALGLTEITGMLHVNALIPGDNQGYPQGIGNTEFKGAYGYDPSYQGYDYSGYLLNDHEAAPGGIGLTRAVPALSAGAGYNSGWLGSLAGVDDAIPGVMIHTPSAEIHAEMKSEVSMTKNPEGGSARSFGEIHLRSTLAVMGGGHIEVVPGGKLDIYHKVEESGWISDL